MQARGETSHPHEEPKSESLPLWMRALGDVADDMFVAVRVPNVIVYMNKATRTHFGLPLDGDAPEGFPLLQHFAEWSRQQFQNEIVPALAMHGTWRGEVAIRDATGKEVPFFGDCRLVSEGGDSWFVGICRRLDEFAPGASGASAEGLLGEYRYRAALAHHDIALSVVGADGVFRYVSPAIRNVLGHNPESLLGRPEAEWVHPDDRDVAALARTALSEPGERRAADYRMLHHDGEWRWVEAQLANSTWDGDPTSTGVSLAYRDVTERKRVEEQLRVRAAQQAAVAALGERALGRVDPATLLHEAVTAVASTLDAEHADLFELRRPDGRLFLRAAAAEDRCDLVGVLALPVDSPTPAGHAVRTRRPLVVADHAQDDRFASLPEIRDGGVASSACVVVDGDGGPWGVLCVHSKERARFGDEDVSFVQAVANVIAGHGERERVEAEVRHRSVHDALTGLPNRTLLTDRLESALARSARLGTYVAVLFLDLDDFKAVNDSFGHSVGDAVLVEVARRVHRAVRAADTVARFGGDEFVVVAEGIGQGHDVTRLAEAILDTFGVPVRVADRDLFLTASIGIAVGGHADTDAEALVRDSDAAMYRAKDSGGGRYEVFDAELRAQVLHRVELDHSLRGALERSELHVVYQPQVDLASGLVTCAEALLRWTHPRLGPVGPAAFVPVAESNGLIVAIGEHVLDVACRQASGWPAPSSPTVSVNVSARQLASPDFPTVVARVLDGAGLDPARLCLEITESVVMDDVDRTTTALGELARLGVALAVDDFGTGYSSLAYLTRLPLDELKIDRSFIVDVATSPVTPRVVAAIVDMAHSLGLRVVAEGVETGAQVDVLRDLGCDAAQGYLFARPAPPEELDAMLERSFGDATAPH